MLTPLSLNLHIWAPLHYIYDRCNKVFTYNADLSSRANINPYKLAFWMIAYIIHNPSLLASLRTETSLAY